MRYYRTDHQQSAYEERYRQMVEHSGPQFVVEKMGHLRGTETVEGAADALQDLAAEHPTALASVSRSRPQG